MIYTFDQPMKNEYLCESCDIVQISVNQDYYMKLNFFPFLYNGHILHLYLLAGFFDIYTFCIFTIHFRNGSNRW